MGAPLFFLAGIMLTLGLREFGGLRRRQRSASEGAFLLIGAAIMLAVGIFQVKAGCP